MVGWGIIRKRFRQFLMLAHISVAKHNGSAIGLARALSDGVFNAAIYDVIVDQSYQNHGIDYDLVCRMIK